MSISESAKIGSNVVLGENVHIGHNCIIEDNVILGDDVYIDSNCIIRSNVTLGNHAFIGGGCIIGEYLMDFYKDKETHEHPLSIGDNALIRSGTIIYAGSRIGSDFQTGHQVTIRENQQIGKCVSIGTKSDVQDSCIIGNYVRLHSNVFVAPTTVIDSFVWIFPHVVLTNDPTPPSMKNVGVHIYPFAVVAAGAILMPGLEIGQDSLVAAGAVVTKPVEKYTVVAGNPAKKIANIFDVKNHYTAENAYPWRNEFERYMPWMGSDFRTWYTSLSVEQKKEYNLENIDLDSELQEK